MWWGAGVNGQSLADLQDSEILCDIFIVYVSKPIDHESSKVNYSVSCGLPVMRCLEAICTTKGEGMQIEDVLVTVL